MLFQKNYIHSKKKRFLRAFAVNKCTIKKRYKSLICTRIIKQKPNPILSNKKIPIAKYNLTYGPHVNKEKYITSTHNRLILNLPMICNRRMLKKEMQTLPTKTKHILILESYLASKQQTFRFSFRIR